MLSCMPAQTNTVPTAVYCVPFLGAASVVEPNWIVTLSHVQPKYRQVIEARLRLELVPCRHDNERAPVPELKDLLCRCRPRRHHVRTGRGVTICVKGMGSESVLFYKPTSEVAPGFFFFGRESWKLVFNHSLLDHEQLFGGNIISDIPLHLTGAPTVDSGSCGIILFLL